MFKAKFVWNKGVISTALGFMVTTILVIVFGLSEDEAAGLTVQIVLAVNTVAGTALILYQRLFRPTPILTETALLKAEEQVAKGKLAPAVLVAPVESLPEGPATVEVSHA